MTYRKVGGDISKAWIDVVIALARQLLHLRFENSPAGFETFAAWLLELKVSKVHVCMEHTGRHHEAFARWLYASGHRVSVVNPFSVSRFGEGRMLRHTTDKSAAETLLMFLKERKVALWEPLGDEYDELRQLVRYRQNLVKRLTALRNQLSSGPVSKYVQEALKADITFHELQQELTDKRIQALVESCEQIKQDVDLLESMVGVRFTNAVKLLAEIGPWSRFPSARALAAYAGYVPCKASSGTLNKRNARASQWGNRHLRESVSCCMLTAARHSAFKAFTKRLSDRGKGADARKARKRKFIEIVYGVLKNRKAFDPSIAFGT